MTKLALLQPKAATKDWEPGFLARVEHELRQCAESNFQIVDQVEEADHILYLDSNLERQTKELAEHKELLELANDMGKFVSALSFKDRPLGALPGIYSSLETRNFDPELHLSWPHLETPNDYVDTAVTKSPDQASFLFTFSGSCSHPIRRRIFSTYGSGSRNKWKVAEVKRWFDHNEDEQKKYIDAILDSRFVLCPRGIACYSHRIFETILLERIPVIIADDWVPFTFGEENYYIQIAEKDLGDITSRLERENDKYDFYMNNLLRVKSRWLTSKSRYLKAVGNYLNFHHQNQSAHDPRAMLDRIHSPEFRRSNGLLSHQKIFSTANAIPGLSSKLFRKLLF